MREVSFLQRGLIAVAVLLGSLLVPMSAAAQEFHMCDLFSLDDASHLLGQPIVNTVDGAEGARFVCGRYAEHGATLLEVTGFQSEDEARARVPLSGPTIAGLGDVNGLVTLDRRTVLLWVAKGPYLVSLEVTLDNPPVAVTSDDLAARVQAVLDNLASVPLPAAPPVRPLVSGGDPGCDPEGAAAISDQLNSPDVTDVKIIGGCHNIAIATSLADSGFAAVGAAQDICDKVAEFAYTGPLTAISVSSRGGRELAIGIKDQECIGEL